ncbi:MAG: rRNA maturation RNase YbeY [Bacteroidetes bacterium]|nr:rRNA maturation RNase YbeY [Bacteroidota bacterium]
MHRIHFFVEQIKFTLKHKAKHRSWIVQTLQGEKKSLGEINYIFCSDAFLLEINTSYLHHNTLTDIITFPIEHAPTPISGKKLKARVSGEIYISIERVIENAEKFQSGFESELKRVMIHGVMHLCGYGDKSATEASKMRKKEAFYMMRFPKHS